jgi:hypothetical protein
VSRWSLAGNAEGQQVRLVEIKDVQGSLALRTFYVDGSCGGFAEGSSTHLLAFFFLFVSSAHVAISRGLL